MSAAASELQFQTASTQSTDHAKIEERDQPAFKQWLELKKKLIEINALPRSKTTDRRRQSQDALGKATELKALMKKYSFLFEEYLELIGTLVQYINEQVKPLEEASILYFKELFQKNGQPIIDEPNFFPKKGGDQLGRRMRIEYLVSKDSKEKRTVDYFIKTHQGGAKSGQSSTRPLDPKELFVYKVLEYTGIGSKVHFFFNPLSPGGFYIANQDCGFSKSTEKQKNKSFITLEALKEKEEATLIHSMNGFIYSGFACADILSRLFYLSDILTNSGNSGFVLNPPQYKFKVIDFSVRGTQGSYFSDNIFEGGYLKANGAFNYSGDVFLKKYLNDVSKTDKIRIAQEVQEKLFSKSGKNLPLLEAIDKAAREVLRFVNENYLNLGIQQIPPLSASSESDHDFHQYVRDVKKNYGKFLQDLNKNALQLSGGTQSQMTEASSASSMGNSNSHLLQFQHVIQQQVETSLQTEKTKPTHSQ